MKLNSIFQNHMILQRETDVKIWGSADKNENITVQIQGKEGRTTTDKYGNWKVVISNLHASTAERLVVCGENNQIELEDVAIGDVWIAAGQSNMEFAMLYEKNYNSELEECGNDSLRFYDVPKVCFAGQEEAFDFSTVGVWRKASRDNLKYFSAVGYYFQKELQSQYKIPIGIIGCNWGGTPSSVWMSEESVKENGAFWYEKYENQIKNIDEEKFWKEQLNNPVNATALMLESDFNLFFMPRTPSMKEIEDFFVNSGGELSDLGGFSPNSVPGCLFKHMVKRIALFQTKGVLWYQGESDDISGKQKFYEEMLIALINEWRVLFDNEGLPFFIVQLPGFRQWIDLPNYNFQKIRECQERVSKTVPNTWLCSISDAGEEMDIHPKNKKIVGHRLALLAKGHIYGEKILCDAPMFSKYKKVKAGIELYFTNADGGLDVCGGDMQALQLFSDGKEINYIYYLEDDHILIIYEQEYKEVNIRFAQTAYYHVSLCNRAGIPAIPFELVIS